MVVAPLAALGWESAPLLTEFLASPEFIINGEPMRPIDVLCEEFVNLTYAKLQPVAETIRYGNAGGTTIPTSRGAFEVAASTGPSRIPTGDPAQIAFFCTPCGYVQVGAPAPEIDPATGAPVAWDVRPVLLSGQAVNCIYTRTVTFTCTGPAGKQFGFFCNDCQTTMVGREIQTNIISSPPCPPTPPAGSNITFAGGCN